MLRPWFAITLLSVGCADVALDRSYVTPGQTADEICAQTSDPTTCRAARAVMHCAVRRKEAFHPSRTILNDDFIRWSCQDVTGVTQFPGDDRGQEYCEYFGAIDSQFTSASGTTATALATGSSALIAGKNLPGADATSGPMVQFDPRKLETLPGATPVGQCIFDTWHQDINVPFPAAPPPEVCDHGGAPGCTADPGLARLGLSARSTMSGQTSMAPSDFITRWNAGGFKVLDLGQSGPGFQYDDGGKTKVALWLGSQVFTVSSGRLKPAIDQTPLMKMVVGFNSNGAAADLVEQCVRGGGKPGGGVMLPGAPADIIADANKQIAAAADNVASELSPTLSLADLDDPFIKGCLIASPFGDTQFGTEWRRSDSAVCVASSRLAQCGCHVEAGDQVLTDPADIGRAVVPFQPAVTDGAGTSIRPPADASEGAALGKDLRYAGLALRGFKLGGWDGLDVLPEHCRRVDTGDDTKTVVACDITAAMIAGDQAVDVKELCRTTYARDVVVHVPVPKAAVVCQQPAAMSAADWAGSCNSGDAPWAHGFDAPPIGTTPRDPGPDHGPR